MIAILSRPSKAVAEKQSNWVASHNPIVYKLRSFGVAGSTALTNSYYVYVDVYELATNKLLGRIKTAPLFNTINIATDGFFAEYNIDISAVLKPYLKSQYINQGIVNYRDATLFAYIKFSEYNLSRILSEFTDEANPIFVVQAARQFGDKFGQNLAEYVPFGDGTPKARFLTKFKEPIAYVGYPFSLSFIYSDHLAGAQLIRVDEELDLNKSAITTTQTQLDVSQRNAVNHLKIKSVGATTRFDKVYLKIGAAITDTYVDPGYVDTGYTV